MRAVLLARVLDDPELRRRVTVLDGDALSAELPTGIRALVACNVLGHLPPGDRRALWVRAARLLAPGGALVLTLARRTPRVRPRTRMASASVGALDYEGGPPPNRRANRRSPGA
ncbi:class I SAM-dependent methyltransferase [Streptomyces sp. M19]